MTALAVALVVSVVGLVGWRWRPAPLRLRNLVHGPRPVDRTGRRRRTRRRGRGATHVVAWAVAALAALVAWPPGLLVLGGAAWVWPRVIAARRRRVARAAVADGLPDLLDLLVLAIGSGHTVALSVEALARVAPPPFGAAFTEVARRTRRGLRLGDALGALPELLGPPVHRLTAALVATERYGVPLGPTLDQLALDARRARARQAELAARKLPVRLSFPLVVCILPAFGLLTLAPLLAGALGSLRL